MRTHSVTRPILTSFAAAVLAFVGSAPAMATPDRVEIRKTQEHKQTGGGLFRITTLSARSDMISGGDVLVHIEVISPAVGLTDLSIQLNGTDVTSAFRETLESSGKRTVLGLVTGLGVGDNVLTVSGGRQDQQSASLKLTNHPISGPIFSGPHETPFICNTTAFNLPVVGGNLGAPLDEHCSIATRVDYVYRTVGNQFRPLLNPADRPADLAMTTTNNGRTVPYIVRVETGTVNRAIYQTAILHDPAHEPAPGPWDRPEGWNGKYVYKFGGGCPGGWYIQGTSVDPVLDSPILSQGYAVSSATLNVFGINCNDLLASETLMMVRERFIEHYGLPQFTIGMGCSGGSYQVHQISDNYPGLLDGIIPGCSFPDHTSAQTPQFADARIFVNYFNNIAPGSFTAEQQRLVFGFGVLQALITRSNAASRLDPTANFHSSVPVELRYHPTNNPTGARATVQDHTVNAFGRDPVTGFARRPLDNVGIQYGLQTLNAGLITKQQFLGLNEHAGGLDIDGRIMSERMVADRTVLRAIYESGRVLDAGRGLASTPIIDYHAYTDLQANGDGHVRYHQFSTRARLVAANGHADNQVMFLEDNRYGLFSTASPVLIEALRQMDRWLTNLAADDSATPRAVKVLRAKPADLADACWTPDPTPQKIVEPFALDGSGACNTLYPIFSQPRMVAGAGIANDIMKCRLKPIDYSDYNVTFTDTEKAQLNRIFPDGVCDWSRRGIEQRDTRDTWLSFGPAGFRKND